MEPITLMGVFALASKTAIVILSVVGISSGVNWMNKKTIVEKKGGLQNESELDDEKFHRTHI